MPHSTGGGARGLDRRVLETTTRRAQSRVNRRSESRRHSQLLRCAMLLLVPACFHPNYEQTACGPDGECPTGLTCSPLQICKIPLTVLVSTTGDDGNDGITQPVKTLKRAFALAVVDDRITEIALAQGDYGADNGESFPYVVPADLTISGTNAKLIGAGSNDGLILESGTLRRIELHGFSVALTITGTVELRSRATSLCLQGARPSSSPKASRSRARSGAALRAYLSTIVLQYP